MLQLLITAFPFAFDENKCASDIRKLHSIINRELLEVVNEPREIIVMCDVQSKTYFYLIVECDAHFLTYVTRNIHLQLPGNFNIYNPTC